MEDLKQIIKAIKREHNKDRVIAAIITVVWSILFISAIVYLTQ